MTVILKPIHSVTQDAVRSPVYVPPVAVVAVTGWSDGALCIGGGTIAVEFSDIVNFTALTLPNGVTIGATGAKVFTITASAGTGTKQVTYTGTWSAPLIIGDTVTWNYDGTGDYAGDNGLDVLAQLLTLVNCLDP